MEKLPNDKKIILFDGVCNLCNSSVQYIIQRDPKDVFRFVSLQSPLGQEIQQYLGIADRKIDSIILYEPKRAYYYKSGAIIEIAKTMPYFSWFTVFRFVPSSLRDSVYDFIAKNRYKWYGKQNSCMIPKPELKGKFLE
jgi:predicted DCC family thiol-disulfide oxidoreductase YuxK